MNADPLEPEPGQKLAPEDFERIIRLTPLVSIDLIVRRKDNRALLGRRKNEPAKGTFFVVGGRVTKKETLESAFRRITKQELGVQLEQKSARCLGVFEHSYKTNFFEKKGFGTHYVALAFELNVAENELSLSNGKKEDQHEYYVWRTDEEIRKSTDVHEYSKEYFELEVIRSETQYTSLATRRNTFNTMLWQTPALSLTALAFLLNIAGNRSAYLEVRVVTCILALVVALFTLQLFCRHRLFEERDSLWLEQFEINNRHLGYGPINAPFMPPLSRINPISWPSFKVWRLIFVIFAAASVWLLCLNLKHRWVDDTKDIAGGKADTAIRTEGTAAAVPSMSTKDGKP